MEVNPRYMGAVVVLWKNAYLLLYNHFWAAAVTLNYLSLQSQVTLKKKGTQKYDGKK